MNGNLKKSQFIHKTIMTRVTILFVLVVLFIILVPTRFGIIKEYLSLKSTINNVSKELVSISETLPLASEVYDAFEELQIPIQVCSVIDYQGSNSTVKGYSGDELELSENRILEFIISDNDRLDYQLASLTAYKFAFDSIDINNSNEVILRIYCK